MNLENFKGRLFSVTKILILSTTMIFVACAPRRAKASPFPPQQGKSPQTVYESAGLSSSRLPTDWVAIPSLPSEPDPNVFGCSHESCLLLKIPQSII
jgi:hypothetical protein